MRTTQSFVFEVVLSPSVGVEERMWNTVSAAKVAPLLVPTSCADVSLGVIGRHALAAPDNLDKDLLEADANNSFHVLEIALAMLSWSSSLAEASPSPSISIPSY